MLRAVYISILGLGIPVATMADQVEPLSPADQLWAHERVALALEGLQDQSFLTYEQYEAAVLTLLSSANAYVVECGVSLPPYPMTTLPTTGLSPVLSPTATRYSPLLQTHHGPCAGGPLLPGRLANLPGNFDELPDEPSAFIDHFMPGVSAGGHAMSPIQTLGPLLGGMHVYPPSPSLEPYEDLGTDWLTDMMVLAEEQADELIQTRLALAVAEQNQEEIVWALEDLATLHYMHQFAADTIALMEDGTPMTPDLPPRDDLMALDGCWMSYDGLVEIEVDGDTLFARDAFDGLWVGVVGSDGLTFTQSFAQIGAYRMVAERMAGGEISAELDAIIETLFAAGIQQEISIYLPDDLTQIDMLDAVFRETLVAEPVVGSVAPTYTAVAPEEAVHGTVWQFQTVWARVPIC